MKVYMFNNSVEIYKVNIVGNRRRKRSIIVRKYFIVILVVFNRFYKLKVRI